MAVSLRAPHGQAATQSILTIQVLRGVAALLVVAHHALILARERLSSGQRPWTNGACGVDIFFVISGFVMAMSSRSLLGKANAAGTFLRRRVERIVPLYWIVTTAKILLLLALPGLALNRLGSRWNMASSYLFLPSYNAVHAIQPVVVVGWTLNYEMLFYGIFAFALWLKKPKLLVVAIGLVLLSLGSFVVGANSPAILSFCNPLVLEFLYGMILFAAFERGLRLPEPLAWGALAFGFAVMLSIAPEGTVWPRFVIWGLPAMAVIAGAVSLEKRVRRVIPRWILAMGDSSYSIYLSHLFVLPAVGIVLVHLHVVGATSIAPAVLLSLLVAVFVGEGTYRWVELPIMNYFRLRRIGAFENTGAVKGII